MSSRAEESGCSAAIIADFRRLKVNSIRNAWWLILIGAVLTAATPAEAASRDRIQSVINEVEKQCLEGPGYVYTIGPVKAKRLAELVRQAKPEVAVECGTALGYSGLWMARELSKAGKGKLVTIEINPELAKKAEAHFRKAGLGRYVTVVLNDKLVIENAQMPGIAEKGPIALQHHGGKRNGKWTSPPSLLQFKNIFIKHL